MSAVNNLSVIVDYLAKKADIKKTQTASILDELAKLACKEAKNSFTDPGLGKIVLVQRKARVGCNPLINALSACSDGAEYEYILRYLARKSTRASVDDLFRHHKASVFISPGRVNERDNAAAI